MIMWNILIIATVTDSRRKTWHPTRLDFIVKRMPRSNRITLKSKVSWTTVTRNMHLSAGTREPLLHVFLSSVHTTHREQMPLTRKEEKKKKPNSPLTCDPGLRGAALHAYRGGSNRVYDCIISPLPHHLSTHQWTLEATTLEQTDQASLIHSPPRCLCQVIAGGKRKTDQYISHGSDR